MGARRYGSTEIGTIEEPVVNLTPLIDVVFVILIMFIVIAPLLESDRVELADALRGHVVSHSAVQENSPISVHVTQNNAIIFRGEAVTIEDLILRLRGAKVEYPHAKVQLFHDKTAHFGTYQSVKNAVEEAGFTEMDVILKPA